VKPSVEQLETLLALKRHERPEEDYWQGFLCEFHQRQREQAVMNNGFGGLIERISTWFTGLGSSKWAYGAGLAYAAVWMGILLVPKDAEVENTPAKPVSYQVIPAAPAPTVEQLDQLDLSPSTQGNAGEQVF
jgi:hypothetical protein